jgi:glycosyltransferase involved in cell wall biosynthesis
VDEFSVSVIVPVRNGRDDLLGLLECLEAQTLARDAFEIVIGDDGSTDGSTDGLETGDGHVRVVSGPPTNSYAARNRAVRLAGGRTLAFCDADCRPEPEWLEAGLRELESADVAAGLIMFTPPKRRTVWTLLDVDSFKDHERQVQSSNAETANLFVRRGVYDAIGGFDDSLPEHGDFDFVQRAVHQGASLIFAPKVVLWHPTRNDARPYLRTVWIMHRWYAAREARAGRRPDRLRVRSWVPVIPLVRSRRRWNCSLGPDTGRLERSGIRTRRRERVLALPAMYLVVPYVEGAAQLRGWFDGRRLR